VDVAVSLKLELGDLRRDPPDPPTEVDRACLGRGVSSESDKGCNVRLKGLKTLSDPQRKLVNLHPKNTTATAINALPQAIARPGLTCLPPGETTHVRGHEDSLLVAAVRVHDPNSR
jgi:hypothetical protein